MEDVVCALILAAGKGTRMKSDRNKVLHEVGGLSMLEQVISQLQVIPVRDIAVVVGYQKEQITESLQGNIHFIEQKEQLGTGHAVKSAWQWLKDRKGSTLVLCGDTPLLTAKTLQKMIDVHQNGQAACTVITAIAENPTGYGRIIRDHGDGICKIVEQKDATEEQKNIREINSGVYCFDNRYLFATLDQLGNNNVQGEYYLTDVVEILKREGQIVLPCLIDEFAEIVGVNDRVALANANQIFRNRVLEHWMLEGVTILDPHTTYIDAQVTLGKDVILYPGTHLRGQTTIGARSILGPNVEIDNCRIGEDTRVRQSVLNSSSIGDFVNVGPFAYIRPGSEIGDHVKIGDFVEIKNSKIDRDSKVSHLSYIGDSDVGQSVNIGCGTVTVNYDGKNKYRTTIKDHAFVGCNANLVAPVTLEEYSFVAAGSTITKDVPDHALAIARSKQANKANYVRK